MCDNTGAATRCKNTSAVPSTAPANSSDRIASVSGSLATSTGCKWRTLAAGSLKVATGVLRVGLSTLPKVDNVTIVTCRCAIASVYWPSTRGLFGPRLPQPA
ncbi:MAG: hypothetical protein Kow0010_08310 [Dehalococcoidia bacterium]